MSEVNREYEYRKAVGAVIKRAREEEGEEEAMVTFLDAAAHMVVTLEVKEAMGGKNKTGKPVLSQAAVDFLIHLINENAGKLTKIIREHVPQPEATVH